MCIASLKIIGDELQSVSDWRFEEGFALSLAASGCTILPIGRVAKFFEEGPENGLACLASAYIALSQLVEELEQNHG
jgi:hypothetical protein